MSKCFIREKLMKIVKFYKTFSNFKEENEKENRYLTCFQYPFYKEHPIYFNNIRLN